MQRLQRIRPFLQSTRRLQSTLPWFVDQHPVVHPVPTAAAHRPAPAALPENTPRPLRELHAQLAQSPHLEPSTLFVAESLIPPVGPELPHRLPQGRRKRGGTYAGESLYDMPGGVWNWTMMAEVSF